MKFGLPHFFRRRVETRESATDQIVARLLASAGGASGGGSLAAIETAARWWGAGLASARVTPSNIALRAITPSVLDTVGRALCRSGESLHVIDVRSGRVALTPASSWEVHGSDQATSWRYTVTLSGPDTTRIVKLDAESVLHVRYAAPPSRPWKGRSPLMMSADTAKAAGLLENATAAEFGFAQRQLLTPRRSQSDYGMTDSLTPELLEKIVASFAVATGSAAMVVPGDLEPRRLGPEPPDSFALLRDRFEASILAMHGIPPALVAASGNGTAMRESYRQVFHALIKPLGALVIQEIQEKIDPDAEIDFSTLRAGDIMSTSRAFGSLVKAGVSPKSAAAAVGLDVEVPE